MAGLFDTFTVAKRGLNVQQGAINTTSHNISNANTVGFSRQRAVSTTTKPFGGMSRFDTCSVGQIGTGAEISSIERIRDSFIDFQVRHENGKLGNYDVQDKFLYNIENIFGEPSDSGIQQLLGEFYDGFQELSKKPHDSSTKTIALQKASALADTINNTYTQLNKQLSDAQELLQVNVKDVNNYLDQINELNKQISSVCAVGQAPNDLLDSRDRLLDELSYKFGITIDRKAMEAIDLKLEGYQNKNNPVNNLVNSSPTDEHYTRFSYVKSAEIKKDASGNPVLDANGNQVLEVKYYPLGNINGKEETIEIPADSADAQGISKLESFRDELIQNRILMGNKDGIVELPKNPTKNDLNNKILQTHKLDVNVNTVDNKHIKGDIAGNQGVQDTIKAYMKDLDTIAASLAYAVNAIQTGSDKAAGDDVLVFVNGVNGDSDINASNITVNKKMLEDVSLLNTSSSTVSGEGNGDRALAIANLRNVKFNLSQIDKMNDRESFFKNAGVDFSDKINILSSKDGSTVNTYYKEIINTLGVNAETAATNAYTQSRILQDLNMQKLSVSGVSLDEEMTNLIQFQHAYSANAKIISTVDELLDVVINGLKR